MYKIFKHRKIPRIPCLEETYIKLQWCNIPSLVFLLLLIQRNFFRLRLRHQTSATKFCYLRSSAFHRVPKFVIIIMIFYCGLMVHITDTRAQKV